MGVSLLLLELIVLFLVTMTNLRMTNSWCFLSPLLSSSSSFSSSSSSRISKHNGRILAPSSLWSSPLSSSKNLSNSKSNNSDNEVDDINYNDNSNNGNNSDDDVNQGKVEVEWGVSYIGGDPCGSKYNDDPFDTSSNRNGNSDKPGLPDDMKKRIQALAEQKLRKRERESSE